MKSFLKRILKGIPFVYPVYVSMQRGIRQFTFFLRYICRYFQTRTLFQDDGRFVCRWKDRFPCLLDSTQQTPFEPHYTYHPAWAARILAKTRPVIHVDIASDLRFVTQVSAFIPVEFYDYRPAKISLSGIQCRQGDATDLPFEDQSVLSLSCMHVIEHIGLERYGDPLDPHGDLKAARELCRILAPGGNLLFVVPVSGEARIQYNAHRIYTYHHVMEMFHPLHCEEFSLVTDTRDFIVNARPEEADAQLWGCGCWWFQKREKE